MSVKDTKHFKELDREIEELERMVRGESSSQVVEPEDTAQFQVAEPVVVVQDEVPVSDGTEGFDLTPISDEDNSSKRTAWKQEYLNLEKRYKKLRATTEKSDLLTRIRSLEDQVDTISARLATHTAPKEQDILNSFSSDEIDLMGGPETVESTVRVANKLMEQKVKPLEEELRKSKEENRKKLVQMAEEEKQSVYNSFLSRLEDTVPDYKKINTESDFLKWLDGYDPESSFSRLDRLRKAQGDGDVPMVASFFTRWVEMKTNKINPALERKIGVASTEGTTISTQQGRPEIIPYSVVKKFYDDDAKGKYRGNPKKADELERKYDLARLQGRIDFSR